MVDRTKQPESGANTRVRSVKDSCQSSTVDCPGGSWRAGHRKERHRDCIGDRRFTCWLYVERAMSTGSSMLRAEVK
jgi:hypothetical protein